MPMRCAALQVLHIAADGASLDEVRALRLVVPRVSTRSTPCEYSQYGVRSLLAPLVSARSTPRVHTPGVPTCGRQREYSGYPVSTRSTPAAGAGAARRDAAARRRAPHRRAARRADRVRPPPRPLRIRAGAREGLWACGIMVLLVYGVKDLRVTSLWVSGFRCRCTDRRR